MKNVFKRLKERFGKKTQYVHVTLRCPEWAQSYVNLLCERYGIVSITTEDMRNGLLTEMKVKYDDWFEFQTKLDPYFITEYKATKWYN